MGYSFGSLITIELARKLEARGFNGQLILIDGSPQQMKTLLNQHMYSSSEEELQSNILLGIMDAFTPTNSEQVRLDTRCSIANIILIPKYYFPACT